MERKILDIKIQDKVTNENIRNETKFKDAEDAIQRKLRWAGHLARRNDNRWTTKTTFWWSYDYTRTQGRPADRWRKDVELNFGKDWHQKAQNRQEWKKKVEVSTLFNN